MPGKWRLSMLLAALVGACGSNTPKSCPADDQTACVDETLGYEAGIADILNERCMPCHAPGGVEMSIPLNDYKRVFNERMTVGNQLATCTMPPDGSPQLTDAERKQILAWLSCGAPE